MKQANKEAIEDVKDMHRGLHMAMEELIKRKDYARSETILHQIDQAMSRWINQTKVTKG
ncbi:hypothetical protein [Tabrizicola sp.]|uniref:hypothetical protein n=1 Tax=Tabrizicola sp. TaxID=2005166 RepID=UPI00286BFAFF|nr:hypothetical protein [Tabrizicola sp.]